MHVVAVVVGIVVILLALVDAFETILQPRRITHRFRYAGFYYRHTWRLWRMAAGAMRSRRLREVFLSIFGPLSLLGLFANWVVLLIAGFAAVDWGAGARLAGNVQGVFWDYLYMSGTTFFTLGYGDVTPAGGFGRAFAVIESGMGFGFLAMVIGYLPVLYGAFSNREAVISLMDARAGSPPSASEVLLRLARAKRLDDMDDLLAMWERWAAELLESHLSFPVLSYYRSQHDNQSWLAVLATILDTCAILMAEIKGEDVYQAQMTFATARHAAVDLGLVLKTPPGKSADERLKSADLARLVEALRKEGVVLREGDHGRLAELRAMYEPFLEGLARRLMFHLPAMVAEGKVVDNWQRSSLGRVPGIGELGRDDDHFG